MSLKERVDLSRAATKSRSPRIPPAFRGFSRVSSALAISTTLRLSQGAEADSGKGLQPRTRTPAGVDARRAAALVLEPTSFQLYTGTGHPALSETSLLWGICRLFRTGSGE